MTIRYQGSEKGHIARNIENHDKKLAYSKSTLNFASDRCALRRIRENVKFHKVSNLFSVVP